MMRSNNISKNDTMSNDMTKNCTSITDSSNTITSNTSAMKNRNGDCETVPGSHTRTILTSTTSTKPFLQQPTTTLATMSHQDYSLFEENSGANRRNSGSSGSSSSNCQSSSSHSDLAARVISGSIGSLITSLIVTPLEVVKIRLQAGGSSVEGGVSFSSSSSAQNSEGAVKATTTTTTTSTTNAPSARVGVRSAARVGSRCGSSGGCGTFTLYNGHMDCVLSKSWVSYYDPRTGQLKGPPPPLQLLPATRPTLGTLAMLRSIFAQEGFQGIYAGLRPTLVMAVPNTVLYFTAYDEIVGRLRQYHHDQSQSTPDAHMTAALRQSSAIATTMVPLVAGASARFVASTVTAPFELLRTRQAAAVGQGASNRAIWEEFQIIVQNEGGISKLFQGLKPTLYRDVPFSAIYWACMEQFKLLWIERERNRRRNSAAKAYDSSDVSASTNTNYTTHINMSAEQEAAQAFVNGAVAGMIAAACTTPFDVVKTRQQQQSRTFTEAAEAIITTTTTRHNPSILCSSIPSATASVSASLLSYPSCCSSVTPSTTGSSAALESHALSKHSDNVWHTMKHIVKTEGISALWTGNQARMLKVAPSCAIMISSYELGKRLLKQPQP